MKDLKDIEVAKQLKSTELKNLSKHIVNKNFA